MSPMPPFFKESPAAMVIYFLVEGNLWEPDWDEDGAGFATLHIGKDVQGSDVHLSASFEGDEVVLTLLADETEELLRFRAVDDDQVNGIFNAIVDEARSQHQVWAFEGMVLTPGPEDAFAHMPDDDEEPAPGT